MPRTLISPWVTASSASSASFTSSPSSATNSSGSGTYTYDGNGQRVEKVSGGTTIVTIFAGSQVLAEYYNNAQPSSPTNEYIYAGSLMIASIQSGTTDYWHNDHLSPRVRTDTSGNVADQRGTFPFGETWYSPGSSPYMFTSYYRDYEAEGNDYAQARTYVGGLGRFSSPDPVSGSTSDPQSLNRYSYVRNMPVMLTDPFGLTPSCNTAKNPDTSQPQDSKSGGGPSATDSGDPSEAEPQNASQNPCDQDPWYYGGGSGLVSIDSGEGFDPGDGASGLIGSTSSNGSVSVGGGAGGWIPDGTGGYYNPTDGCYTNRGNIYCNWQGYLETFGDASPGTDMYDLGGAGGGQGGAGPQGSQSPIDKCKPVILNAVNSQFNTNFTASNISGAFQYPVVPAGTGTVNIDVSVPAQNQPNGVSPGRYPESVWTYIFGIGPTLHIPSGPGGLDSPQTLNFSNSQFTAHIDSAYPYNPIGAVFHLFHDVLGLGGHSPCP